MTWIIRKRCRGCRLDKLVGAFGRDHTERDGLKIECRGCKEREEGSR